MSDEKFMEKSRTWLDDLKIRAGYGTTGNSNIDSYNWAFQYGTGNRYLYSINGSDTEVYQGFGVTNLGDIEANGKHLRCLMQVSILQLLIND